MREFQSLDFEGVRQLVDMAQVEGWNPGLHDAETFWRTDPEAFVGLRENGRLIAGGSIVRHSSRFGFMGLFIVHPEFRAQGLGRELWLERRRRLLDRLDEGATIGMDGVTAMLPFYQKGGFQPYYLSARYQITASVESPRDSFRRLSAEDLEEVARFDQRCFPSDRTAYLKAWLQQPDATTLGVGSELQGIASLRPCDVGFKIGPLFALDKRVAELLLLELLSQVPGQTVAIDVPTCNEAAVELCELLGMQKVFECTRMYLGSRPNYETNFIYGITSFELG